MEYCNSEFCVHKMFNVVWVQRKERWSRIRPCLSLWVAGPHNTLGITSKAKKTSRYFHMANSKETQSQDSLSLGTIFITDDHNLDKNLQFLLFDTFINPWVTGRQLRENPRRHPLKATCPKATTMEICSKLAKGIFYLICFNAAFELLWIITGCILL